MAYGFTYTLPTITGSHSDFPVGLFHTPSGRQDFPSAAIDGGSSSILNGGGNLRAYTSSAKTTRLPVDVESFVAGGTPAAEVWVKIPAAATGNTIYIEADDTETTQPAVTNTYGRNAVWSDYAAVIHGGSVVDSSGNLADGTLGGGLSSTAVGPFGWGNFYDFDGDDDVITFEAVATPKNVQVTIQTDESPSYQAEDNIVGNLDSSNNGFSIMADYQDYDSGRLNTYVSTLHALTGRHAAAAGSANAGTYLLHESLGSGLYINGSIAASYTPTTRSTSTTPLLIGGGPGFTEYAPNGRVGEVRLRDSVSALSSDWISTEYANQSASGAWGTVGTWADSGGGSTYTLTANTAAFATSLSTTGLLASRVLSASTSAFTTTTSGVDLLRNYRLTAVSQNWSTGFGSADLLARRVLAVATQSQSTVLTQASLYAQRTVAPDTCIFTTTANGAGLLAQRVLGAGSAAYATTFRDVGLSYSQSYTLSVSAASFTTTMNGAELLVRRHVAADSASYVTTLSDTGLQYGQIYALIVDTAAFRTGTSTVALNVSRKLNIDPAAFATTLNAIGFARQYRVAASTAQATTTFLPAQLLVARKLQAATQGYVTTLTDTGLTYNETGSIAVAPMTFTTGLTAVELKVRRKLAVNAMDFSSGLYAADLAAARYLAASRAEYATVLTNTGLTYNEQLRLSVDTAAFTTTFRGVSFNYSGAYYERVLFDQSIQRAHVIDQGIKTSVDVGQGIQGTSDRGLEL